MAETQLTFIIAQTSVSFAEVLRSSGELLRTESYTFSSNSDVELRTQLSAFIEKYDLKSQDYHEYSLAWCSEVNALVPMSVFDSLSPEVLSHSIFGDQIPSHELDFNRLVEHGIVNLYQIPLWVKSFFVINFPRIAMQHERTIELRTALNSDAFKPKAYISIFDDYFGVAIVYHNNLIFSNCFNYQTVEDLVYYLQYAMNKADVGGDKIKINCSTASEVGKALAEELMTIMLRINSDSSVTGTVASMHKNQLLCV